MALRVALRAVRAAPRLARRPTLYAARAFSTSEAEAPTTEPAKPDAPPPPSTQEHTFQAETRSLLNIVSNALYTEREVFLRELLSNASDALEKCRLRRVSNEPTADGDDELHIAVTVDKERKTLTIEDSGIGMTASELGTNLGTIALSGSKKFAAEASKKGDDASSIIGQFGVGFYSAFMVGDAVTVESRSADPGAGPAYWRSEDGAETYDLGDGGSKATRGSKITIQLKDDAAEYLEVHRLKEVVQKYSNFVAFPITVDGETANGVGAVWAADPREVSDDQYAEFYRHTFKGAWDTPFFHHHFRAEAPLDVKCVLYVPSFHAEKGGMARLEPSVALYSRKVLIEDPCEAVAPDWMRFVKGVVDSEDLPLSISREKSQDRRLLDKLQDVVVRKFLRFLLDKAKQDRAKYLEFYAEYSTFLKEGACHDHGRRADLAKLLYFDTSSSAELTSLDEYVGRLPGDAKDDDDKIYYLHAPTRELALASPYYEAFKDSKRECLFVYNAIDDFVMSNLGTHNGRPIVAAERATFAAGGAAEEKTEESDGDEKAPASRKLDDAEAAFLAQWMVRTLDDRLESVVPTDRLSSSPAVLADAESGAMRRMMALVAQQSTGEALPPLPKQKLEVNPKHPVVLALHDAAKRSSDDATALHAAHQLLDTAIVAAGLMDDARTMIPRLNKLLELALLKQDK